MKRERFIRVPKDKQAMKDYDLGIQKNEQLEELVLSDEQYTLLDQLKLFDQINDQCDVIIDDYEEEILSLEKIPLALKLISKMLDDNTNKELTKIKELLELALKYKTIVEFDF